MSAYERWKIFQLAIELREITIELSKARPRGHASDLDHLRRAASSVVFNIAEGASHRQKGRKLEFYRTALGSAGECNAVLLILSRVHPHRQLIRYARDLCDHIAALMTNLMASVERRPD